MVRIRLTRTGRKGRASYRIVAADSRLKRDGRHLEVLGTYDPAAPDEAKFKLKVDRIQYWLSVGAQPSEPVAAMLKKAKIRIPWKQGRKKNA